MMEMSRGAESEKSKVKGVAKTEVPTKIHWAKRKQESIIHLQISLYHYAVDILTFCFESGLTKIYLTLSSHWVK